jgi:hypothetical protein
MKENRAGDPIQVTARADDRNAAVPHPYIKEQRYQMKSTVAAILLTVGVAGQVSAQQGGLLARFDGGIGVDPIATFAGTEVSLDQFTDVRRNSVRGVGSSGFSWRIADLKADIYTDGRVKVTGRGLVLASGFNIGQNNDERVVVFLSCVGAGDAVTEFSTDPEGVPLEANGDFSVDAPLNAVPSECASPVLLIRSHRTGRWLAAGVTASKDR